MFEVYSTIFVCTLVSLPCTSICSSDIQADLILSFKNKSVFSVSVRHVTFPVFAIVCEPAQLFMYTDEVTSGTGNTLLIVRSPIRDNNDSLCNLSGPALHGFFFKGNFYFFFFFGIQVSFAYDAIFSRRVRTTNFTNIILVYY
jgi:hypothetical protein